MRRAPILVTSSALVGCAALSGLDQLSIGSDAADATAADASSTDETSSDAPTDGTSDASASTCAYESTPGHCFGQVCDVQSTCCVASADAACAPTCGAGVSMICTSNADCTSSTEPICCIQNVTSAVTGCPLVLETDQNLGSSTECTSNDACKTAGHGHLCSASSDCPSGQTCVQAAFGVNVSKIFGLCH